MFPQELPPLPVEITLTFAVQSVLPAGEAPMRKINFGPVAVMAALATAAAMPEPARAAVGVCKPLHAGERAEDKAELAAKARALESWVAGAKQHGAEYTRWGIAWNRRLGCTRMPDGKFSCRAEGHPCTYQQVAPENFIRFKRGGPS